MVIDDIILQLRTQFNNRIAVLEKRPDTWQLILPVFHEDGDMLDIFLNILGDGTIRISDYGMTLMRLSYSYELNTPRKEEIFRKILTQSGVIEEQGTLVIETRIDHLYPSLMLFIQVVGKISNMKLFQREVIRSLFYEELDDAVNMRLQEYRPQRNILPIPKRDDLEVDYQFQVNSHEVFLFGIKDSAQARLAALACLEFQKANLQFKGFAVHEDFEGLSRKDRIRITSAADKQFTSLDDFREHAAEVFKRERGLI